MKQTKLTKIFVLILSLALLIGSAVGIAASAEVAEDTTTYNIKAMNVAYGDRFQVVVVVDAPVEEGDNIELTYTLNGVKYTATRHPENFTVGGVTYPTYYTHGIAAKFGGDDILIEAHAKDATEYTPVYKNIGIASYLNTLLYKVGYITETEGEDLDRKNLYLSCLDYIASAQKVLWNQKYPENPKTPVSDKHFVDVTNGTIGNTGMSAAVFLAEGKVTLNYTGEGENNGWLVSCWDGEAFVEAIVEGNTVPVSEYYTIVTPYIQDASYTNDFTALEEQTFIEVVGDEETMLNGKYTQFTYTNNTSAIPAPFNYTLANTNTTVSAGRVTNPGAYLGIVDDDGNKVLHYNNGRRDLVSGDNARGIGFTTTLTEEAADANVAVYSFDIKFLEDSEDGCFTQIGFGGTKMYPQVTKSGSRIIVKDYGANNTDISNTITFNITREYTNLRFEYYFDEGVCQVYCDGVYGGDLTKCYGGGQHGKVTTVGFGADSNTAVNCYMDNIVGKLAKQVYVEDPVSVLDCTNYVMETVTWTCTDQRYKDKADAGDFVDYGVENSSHEFSVDNFVLGSSVSVAGSSSSSYSNIHGGSAKLVVDPVTGNKYIEMISPARVYSTTDRAYGLKIARPNSNTNEGSVTVTEFDFRVDSTVEGIGSVYKSPFNMIIYGTSGKYAQWQFTNDSSYTNLSFNNTYFGKWNEWNSIRIEFYGGEGAIKIYVKNAAGEYEYSGTWTNAPFGSTDSGHAESIAYLGNFKELSMACSESANFCIDNVAVYNVDKAYVAE